jgi:hypothetical protein
MDDASPAAGIRMKGGCGTGHPSGVFYSPSLIRTVRLQCGDEYARVLLEENSKLLVNDSWYHRHYHYAATKLALSSLK